MHLQAETWTIICLLLAALAAVRMWLHIVKLEKKLDRVTNGLLQLVDESESATNELRRSLEGLVGRTEENGCGSSGSASLAEQGIDPNEPWDIDRRHRVISLARRGLAAREISRRLCLPEGEVDLLLRLCRPLAS